MMDIPGDANTYKMIGMLVGAGLYLVAAELFYVRPNARKRANEWLADYRRSTESNNMVTETNDPRLGLYS